MTAVAPTPLKPCPFCGNEPWGLFGPHETLGTCWVECWESGAESDLICGNWHFHGTREETAEAWNRRELAALRGTTQPDERELRTLARAHAWRGAITLAHNICVQISDRYNADDDTEQADAALQCAEQIKGWLDYTAADRAMLGSLPEKRGD